MQLSPTSLLRILRKQHELCGISLDIRYEHGEFRLYGGSVLSAIWGSIPYPILHSEYAEFVKLAESEPTSLELTRDMIRKTNLTHTLKQIDTLRSLCHIEVKRIAVTDVVLRWAIQEKRLRDGIKSFVKAGGELLVDAETEQGTSVIYLQSGIELLAAIRLCAPDWYETPAHPHTAP